jgi:hypothetical protein
LPPFLEVDSIRILMELALQGHHASIMTSFEVDRVPSTPIFAGSKRSRRPSAVMAWSYGAHSSNKAFGVPAHTADKARLHWLCDRRYAFGTLDPTETGGVALGAAH